MDTLKNQAFPKISCFLLDFLSFAYQKQSKFCIHAFACHAPMSYMLRKTSSTTNRDDPSMFKWNRPHIVFTEVDVAVRSSSNPVSRSKHKINSPSNREKIFGDYVHQKAAKS